MLTKIDTRFGEIKIDKIFAKESEAVVAGYTELFESNKTKIFSKSKAGGISYAMIDRRVA